MDSWKEKVDAAYDMVHALCQPRGSEGSRQWIMSIPAREDYDPDLVITSGLKSAAKEIHTLTAERDRLAAELDAANATLDRLREVLAKWMAFDAFNAYDAIGEIRAILYPETPSIRDTAAAHGFDAMPDDLAQRSVDGETNYVRLNPENET